MLSEIMSGLRDVPRKRYLAGVSCLALVTLTGLPAVAQADATTQEPKNQAAVETVVVTGSYVHGVGANMLASPLQVITPEDIQKTGYSSIEGLLNLNTANIGSMGGVQDLVAGGADNHATRSANLRGLGPSSTLVLLNGHRIASQEADPEGNNYVSLDALIPMIAVQRVETVLDGASALYGSDAIAGVMNIIPNNHFSGLQASAQYTHVDKAPGYTVQAMLGGGDDKFHAMVAASFSHTGGLQMKDRKITDFNNTSGISQPGDYILSSRPRAPGGGDLIIDNGVNGPVNYSALYDAKNKAGMLQFADPYCDTPGTGGFYSGANPFPLGSCLFSYQQNNPLRPESNQILVYSHVDYDLNADNQLFLEARWYRQDAIRRGIGSLPITSGSLTVPASNPYNPFGVNATYVGRVLGSNAPYLVDKDQISSSDIIGGAKGALFGSWTYSVDAEWTEATEWLNAPDTNLRAVQNALDGYGGKDCTIDPFGNPAATDVPGQGNCYYYSPFGKDQASNPSQIRFNLLAPVVVGFQVKYYVAEGVISGTLFNLPAGPVGVAIGGQWRKESFSRTDAQASQYGLTGFSGKNLSGNGSRSIKAFFAELDAPLMHNLDLQLAGRYEDYGQFNTFDPKIGLNWHALPWLTLRASASKAFRAPALSQSTGNTVTVQEGQTFDPLQVPADQGTFREIEIVSNPKLQPEKSTNYNFGVTVVPIDNLVLSADYWHFQFKNQITRENAQQVINSNPSGPQVIRDSSGRMLGVMIGYFNSGSTETDGIDLQADYTYQLGSDSALQLHNAVSWIDAYNVQLGQNAPVVDVVGRRNSNNPGYPTPRFRDNFTSTWTYGGNSFTVGMRYTGGVVDDLGSSLAAPPKRRVADWTVFDAQYAYSFGSSRRYRIAVGAINLFDRKPPHALYTGYLPGLEDALGLQAYLRFDIKM